MTFLEVRRATGGWGIIRQVDIELDGAVVLSLPRRSTGSVQVSPGRHSIVARMGWGSSPPLELMCAEGETTRVEVIALPPESHEWKIPFVWFRLKPELVLKARLVEK